MHKRNNDPPVKRRTDSPAETQPLISRIATNEYSNIQRQRRVSQRLKSSKKLLALLPEDEQDKFWLYGEGPPATLPFDLIHDAFSEQVSKNPLNVAVEHGQGSITYAELDDWSNQLAAFLVSQGIGVGDSVPLFLERSISMVVGILAILKTGASYAPQHVGVAPDSQLKYVADSLYAKIILTISKFQTQLETCITSPCISIDRFMETHSVAKSEPPSLLTSTASINTNNVALILFTSGTTGKPNGVLVTHRNLCNILLLAPGNMGIEPGTKVSQLLSISFDMAAWEILGCLCNGGTLLIRGKDIPATARRANVIIATPSILSRIPVQQCDAVERVAVAGEPCPRSLADNWSAVCTFYNSCGPTETTIVNTMRKHNPSSDILCIGSPTPNNTVYVLNKRGLPCRIGETGEMWAGGYCVSAGYLDNPELTKTRYRSDPFLGGTARMFNTRDLGRWTKDGRLEHLGRTDDQVKIRGFRVELDSVATVLESVDGCVRATACKLDDRTLVGFVSPETVDTEVAKATVAKALPYYCVPASVYALTELPLTSRGKIDKRRLLDIASDARDSEPAENGENKIPLQSDIEPATKTVAERLEIYQKDSDQRIKDYAEVALPAAPDTLRAKLTHHRFYHYWRLVTLMAIVNLAILGMGVIEWGWFGSNGLRLDMLMNMAVANLTIAIIFRQQYVINLLFKLATSTPLWAPLRFRQLMGKVYHFGGIHVGGAVFGSVWMLFAIIAMYWAAWSDGTGMRPSGVTLFAATQLLLVLILLLVMANPAKRQSFHNSFEIVHRFGGWFSLVMFWILAVSFTKDLHSNSDLFSTLSTSGVIWALTAVTISILLPWLRLKRVPVNLVRPSNHVVLANFDYGVTPFAGSSTAISRNPLTEWHSFANVPAPGKSGFRLTISRAGDWTGRLIDDLPSHLWVKGIPTAGVGNVDQLFKQVVWVATGSGIGPTLPHLLSREVPANLVWSTRNARKTYGDDLVDEIYQAEPTAVIWDTDKLGRPDLVQLAYAAVKKTNAEAVIVIANEKLTRLVVHNMEARGIPAYGAIWDS